MRPFMDQPDMHPQENSELAQMRQQFEHLQQLVISALVLVIIISGAFNLFLLRQVKYSRIDLAVVRPEAQGLVDQYNKSGAPALAQIVKRFIDYGKTHPDFQPILIKYKLLKPPSESPATGAPPKR
jgi:hypothetical protein